MRRTNEDKNLSMVPQPRKVSIEKLIGLKAGTERKPLPQITCQVVPEEAAQGWWSRRETHFRPAGYEWNNGTQDTARGQGVPSRGDPLAHNSDTGTYHRRRRAEE
jgi:hypothetical protein